MVLPYMWKMVNYIFLCFVLGRCYCHGLYAMSVEDFSILAREDQNLLITIKEAIYIRANNPSLNRNVGKFHLPHIWDEVLLNISELKLK